MKLVIITRQLFQVSRVQNCLLFIYLKYHIFLILKIMPGSRPQVDKSRARPYITHVFNSLWQC
jgi:hypothetical protein